MKIWTIQTEPIYNQLKLGDNIYSTQPEKLSPIVQDWFMKKTKFKQWPVWCWLSLPNLEHIQSHMDRIKRKEKVDTIILELNIPNNEKMIFVEDEKWRKVITKEYQTPETIERWDEIFNLKSIQQGLFQAPIRVCINHLNHHWIENSYKLKSTSSSCLESA